MPPGSTAKPPPPAAETVANHGAESSSREYAQPAAGWCRSGSQNPARSSRCDRLAVGHAAVRTAPSPNSDRVAAPTAARKTAARLASSARINRPRNSLSSPPENVGNAHLSGLSSPSGVGLLFRNGFRLSGKANLHPLAFYTINVTSPDCATGARENSSSLSGKSPQLQFRQSREQVHHPFPIRPKSEPTRAPTHIVSERAIA